MSDTGRPGPDPSQPTGRPTWGPTGSTPPSTPPAAPPPLTSWQAAQSTPPPPAPTAAVPASIPPATDGPPPADESRKRPGWVLPVVIGLIVLVVAAIIAFIVTSKDDGSTPVAVASTVHAPSPTPTVQPVARTATTPFATALPTSVLQYSLASSADDTAWTDAGALEAYTETYTDGGTGTATVVAGQWETAPEATAFAATLVDALPAASAPAASPSTSATAPALPQSGDVTVGGATVGSYTIVDAGDGTGVAVWTNGTAVFQATVPVADVVNFYSAYPL